MGARSGDTLLGEPLDGAGKHFFGMRGRDPARSVTWPAVGPAKCFPVCRVRRAARRFAATACPRCQAVSVQSLQRRCRHRKHAGPACRCGHTARRTRATMPSTPRSRKSTGAIHPRVFRPRVLVVSSYHVSFEPRAGCGCESADRRADYVRARVQDDFPACGVAGAGRYARSGHEPRLTVSRVRCRPRCLATCPGGSAGR